MLAETKEPDVMAMMDLLYCMPDDDALFNALQDKLMDLNVKPAVALAVARRQRLDGKEQAAFVRAVDAIGEKTRRGARLRSTIRFHAGITSDTHRRIVVSRGDGNPIAVGETGFSTFENGDRASMPAAAIRAGHRLTYHPSTLSIQVGANWVVELLAADGRGEGRALKWHKGGAAACRGTVSIDSPDGGRTVVIEEAPVESRSPTKGGAA